MRESQTAVPSRRAAVGAAAPRYVTVGGVRLAFDEHEHGRGPSIVCLHAIGHGAGDFALLCRALEDRYRVLALDWPGQGRSDPDSRPASAERYAQLLEAFLMATGVERPLLVGNSIGGAAALRYAAAHPGQVRGLVLENPGGLGPTDDLAARVVLRMMARFFEAGARGGGWFGVAFAAYYRLCVLQRAAAADQRRRIVASAYEIAPVLAEAWRGFANPASDLRDLAPRVECPVLFAWATRDRFVTLSRSLPAIRRVPNARVERFPAGHAAHLETPEAFAAAVERFLAEIMPAPPRSVAG